MTKHAIQTPYEDLLSEILYSGHHKPDRTGTGTLSLPFRQLRYDLNRGFPLITTKRVWMKGIIHELLWFLSGDTNIKYLTDNDVHIWDEWADKDGDLGPVYGAQWRHWDRDPQSFNDEGVDQITALIEGIRNDPAGRRHIVTAWNPTDLEFQGLPPCHMLFQMYVADGKLSCQLTQRSADMFLGVPFNIASYALLTHMVAAQCGLSVGEFVWSGGDCHIYSNHIEQVREQLSRDARAYPTLRLAERDSIFDYTYDDIQIDEYDPHPLISGKVAI